MHNVFFSNHFNRMNKYFFSQEKTNADKCFMWISMPATEANLIQIIGMI